MGLLNEAQTLLNQSKKNEKKTDTAGLTDHEKDLAAYVERTIKYAAKKGCNKSSFPAREFTENVINLFREEGLIVWDNDISVNIIVPVN